MLKVADNERMTRVERDAPMGRMLRSTYWFPVSLSESVEADGAPRRVKLLGENYVVWRSTDGRAAMFDEACLDAAKMSTNNPAGKCLRKPVLKRKIGKCSSATSATPTTAYLK
jgi:hypothetical protein